MYSLTLAFLCCAVMVQSAHKDRHEQIQRMKRYELIHMEPQTVDDDTSLLVFDAFGQHYEVELHRKALSASSLVTHSNVDSNDHHPLSSNTVSCHYNGFVANTEGASLVSASMCDRRGIRGRISAFGQTLIIKPSAYYLDLAKDKLANHTLDDELLVYRLSDFEHPKIMDSDGVTFDDDVEEFMGKDAVTNNDRRRLYNGWTSWDPAETEMAVIIGPVRTANYKYDYGDNWYTQLYQDTADLVNAVDDIYMATNWNANGRNSVGGINSLHIVFSEIHVIHEFIGTYWTLRPQKRTPEDCDVENDGYDDGNYCSVYGSQWLSDIRSWVGNHMTQSQYDNVQFITDIKFNWEKCPWWAGFWLTCSRTLGWGGIGTMCKGSSSVSVDSYAEDFGGNENLVGTVAHELGHNFGLYHDGQSGPASTCCADCGLMGYGDNKDSFSTCSLDGMEDYFNGWGYGMNCLSNGWSGPDDFVSNVNSQGASTQETCPGVDCVYVNGYSNNWENHDGQYQQTGQCFNDHKVYIGPNDENLCYSESMNRWFMSYSTCDSNNPFAMSSHTGGDVTAVDSWMISYRGSFYTTPAMIVSACSADGAFTDDTACLNANTLGEEICLSTQSEVWEEGSLWNGERTFALFDELCMNDKPIYHFVQYDDSTITEYDNFTLEEVEETTYYVHYQMVTGWSAGDTSTGIWMMTMNEISTNYMAFCMQQNLEECTGNNWYIQSLVFDDAVVEQGSNATASGDGYIRDILNEFMSITDGRCGDALTDEEGKTSGGNKTTMIVLIVLCVLMLLMLICAAPFVVRKCMEYRGDGVKSKHAVGDMEEDVDNDQAGNTETMLEVEVEVTSTRD